MLLKPHMYPAIKILLRKSTAVLLVRVAGEGDGGCPIVVERPHKALDTVLIGRRVAVNHRLRAGQRFRRKPLHHFPERLGILSVGKTATVVGRNSTADEFGHEKAVFIGSVFQYLHMYVTFFSIQAKGLACIPLLREDMDYFTVTLKFLKEHFAKPEMIEIYPPSAISTSLPEQIFLPFTYSVAVSPRTSI